MEADSTTYEKNPKASVDTEPVMPFNTCPENLKLYKEFVANTGEKILESQVVERLQNFGLLPNCMKCPTNKPDCKVACRVARVVDSGPNLIDKMNEDVKLCAPVCSHEPTDVELRREASATDSNCTAAPEASAVISPRPGTTVTLQPGTVQKRKHKFVRRLQRRRVAAAARKAAKRNTIPILSTRERNIQIIEQILFNNSHQALSSEYRACDAEAIDRQVQKSVGTPKTTCITEAFSQMANSAHRHAEVLPTAVTTQLKSNLSSASTSSIGKSQCKSKNKRKRRKRSIRKERELAGKVIQSADLLQSEKNMPQDKTLHQSSKIASPTINGSQLPIQTNTRPEAMATCDSVVLQYYTAIIYLPEFGRHLEDLTSKPEMLIKFLAALNKEVGIDRWKVYKHKIRFVDDATDNLLIVGISTDDIELLRRKGSEIHYLCGSVYVKVKGLQSVEEAIRLQNLGSDNVVIHSQTVTASQGPNRIDKQFFEDLDFCRDEEFKNEEKFIESLGLGWVRMEESDDDSEFIENLMKRYSEEGESYMESIGLGWCKD